MFAELTKYDILNCLIEGNLLPDFEKNTAIKEKDICYLTHLHADNLARVFSELAKEYQGIADDYLQECLVTPNDSFRIDCRVTRKVNIAKLIELRPDLYESYRILQPAFIARCLSPWDLIGLIKEAGITEEEIRADAKNVKVNVNPVEKLLNADEAEQILVPEKYIYTVFEVEA